ncbi:G-protein coupled receptor dmsr-1-like [Condylostylus longicornis]|uniref:G-protein coupled receptor dmsr-1-like n=1 Tax=Condylostylus longicornis TaxID=2530218 RepID=UPI00244DCEF3|nr:G-protein coupled receptor dmsr-1-like [Condylostylus longicornis]
MVFVLNTDMNSPMLNDSKAPIYCGKSMDDFHTAYFQLHGYISLIVCTLGTIANILNIIVLTRKEMQSPTNFILTGLAFADLSVMIEYIPYATHSYIHKYMGYSDEQIYTYSWTVYVKFHSIFGQICHTISIWLTVTLAIWRYIAVAYPQRNRILCGTRNTVITIAAAYVICPLIVVPPSYLSFDVTHKVKTVSDFDEYNNENIYHWKEINSSEYVTETLHQKTTFSTHLKGDQSSFRTRNITLYNIQISELAREYEMLYHLNVWIYAIIIKLIPCIALTILSLRLIAALLEAKRRRKLLASHNKSEIKLIGEKTVSKPRKHNKALEKEKQTDRTTKMLLAVLLLFLITEFPQAILGFLVLYLEKTFMFNCYLKLGDLMDILALINSGINFILYCSMSRQFRLTFSLLFRPKFLDKWLPVPQNDIRTQRGTETIYLTTQVTQI